MRDALSTLIENNSLVIVTGQETINAPAGCLFIRGIQVYDRLQQQELTDS